MKKLSVSGITGSVGMPAKSGTLFHIQSAYQEAISYLGQAMAGSAYDPSKVYILGGCVNSGSGSTYNISSGAIFYAGEVYLVDAASFTISGANVAVGIVPTGAVTIGLTYYSDVSADPVQFTDGINRNVHEIRKCVIQAGLSGSGAANFNDFIDLARRIQGGVGDLKTWVLPGAITTYFNTNGAGIHPYTFGWQIANGQNGSVDMRGRVPVGYDPSDPDFNNPFINTGGSKTHANTIEEMAPHTHKYDKSGTFTGTSNFLGGGTYDPVQYPEDTTSVGGGTPYSIMNPYRSVLWVQRMN